MMFLILLLLPGDAPASASPPKASVSVQLVSPNERQEESVEVTLARVSEISGASKPFETRKLLLPIRPKPLKVVIDNLDPGRYLLAWTGHDIAHGEKAIELRSASPLDAGNIQLGPGVSVEGIVRDDTGEPVAGIALRFDTRSEDLQPLRLETGGDGRFALAGLPFGEKRNWTVHDSRRPYFPAAGTWGGESWLEITLQRAPIVRGHVVDDKGEAVRGARVTIANADKDSRIRYSQPVQDDGSFSFPLPWPAKANVTVSARGSADARREIAVSAEEIRGDEIDLGAIVLSRGRTITGFVVEAGTGHPVEGATVSLRPAEKSEGEPRPFLAVSDTQGRYTLEGVPDRGSWRAWASKSGYVAQARALEETSGDDLSFSLSRGGRIEGRLCAPPDEKGQPFVSASPPPPWFEGKTAPVDAAGRFVLEGLAPGAWRLSRGSQSVASGSVTMSVFDDAVRVLVEDGGTATVSIGCEATGR